MRSLSTTLLSSLVLPLVVVHGFQASAMSPRVGPLPSTATAHGSPPQQSVDHASAVRRRRANAGAPLRYAEDADAVAVTVDTLPLSTSQRRRATADLPAAGGAAVRRLARTAPLFAVAAALVAVALAGGLASVPLFAVPPALALLFAGAVAGVVSRTCCAPLEMASTVMMCRGDAAASLADELRGAWRKEGWRGLFKGNGANCLKVAPSRGMQFLVYEAVKRRMVAAGLGVVAATAGAGATSSLHAGARLFAGGIAGMAAAALVYPLEVVKTMLTLYPDKCRSITAALSHVFHTSGVQGLYRGLGPTLVAMFPYVGVEFMVYETFKRRWEVYTGGPAGTVALLLLGAAGGAAAQMCAHPLDVIRRRMQMQGMRAAAMGEGGAAEEERYPNMFAGLYRVGRTEGAHVLFSGLGPACLEKIPSTAIGYFIYEYLKATLKFTSL